MTTDRAPVLSVVVPAHQGTTVLPLALDALSKSTYPRNLWELIVVDDASTDDTAQIAARYADTVVRLPGKPHGPAYARNRAAEYCRGEILVFVDADVTVHEDALEKIAAVFSGDGSPGAVFGSYDLQPAAPGLVSRYRNLLHHYYHHRGAGPAETFWAGLGAVRRSVFEEVGGFDEWHYERPQIEDIELGRRIRLSGSGITLDPQIQGTHLKHWKLWNVFQTDLLHRGIPWMRLMIREGSRGDTLNTEPREKVCVALTGVVAVASLAFALMGNGVFLAAAAIAWLAIGLLNHELYRFMFRQGGISLATVAVPLHLAYYFIGGTAVVAGHTIQLFSREPSPSRETVSRTASGDRTWPPVPKPPRYSMWGTVPDATVSASNEDQ